MPDSATSDTVVESGTTGGPATPPTSTPAPPSEDYRAKFSGVVQKFDALQARLGYQKWEDVPPAAQVQTWREAHDKLADAETKVTSLTGDLEVTRGQAASLATWQSKVKTILEVDPSLIEFVDDIGTGADAEAQKGLVVAFQAKLSKRLGAAATTPSRAQVQSVPPSSPPIPTGDTVDRVALYSQMAQAMQASRNDPTKREEYEKLREQWYATP